MKAKSKKRRIMQDQTKGTVTAVDQKVSKISELHMEKLQIQFKKEDQISKGAVELFQMELNVKQRRVELEAFTAEVQKEGMALNNDLSQTYGNVNINPQTGEYTNRE
ncbi:hypothetical protein [Flavobacterium sp. HSC-61S13]|uniref:hypothetical protein n=1 Tax=Flavobacterium sp. HSC-61S13 TaxID=2910963 RepID=UPI0020A154A1|nr:hypothetical protein [Flavobacterium sp. HSC-61S13]MCP1996664.1 fructose-1,6-bisphosphatase [Flavobacterium sp. HSC-61S13]